MPLFLVKKPSLHSDSYATLAEVRLSSPPERWSRVTLVAAVAHAKENESISLAEWRTKLDRIEAALDGTLELQYGPIPGIEDTI